MMFRRLSKFAATAGAAAMLSTGALATVPKPASADTTSTLIYAAAAIGALILYNNYQHKRQAANSVVGYTANGGTVYGDGRIVMPNGQTVYPNANGQYPTGQYAYYNPSANSSNYRYDYHRTGEYDRTGRHRNNTSAWNGNRTYNNHHAYSEDHAYNANHSYRGNVRAVSHSDNARWNRPDRAHVNYARAENNHADNGHGRGHDDHGRKDHQGDKHDH